MGAGRPEPRRTLGTELADATPQSSDERLLENSDKLQKTGEEAANSPEHRVANRPRRLLAHGPFELCPKFTGWLSAENPLLLA